MADNQAGTDDKLFNITLITALLLTFLVPLLVMPGRLQNAFHTPKTALIVIGVSILLVTHMARFMKGPGVPPSSSSIRTWLVIIIFVNALSFLYTENPYYTRKAFILNVSALLFFHFISLHMNKKAALLLIWCACLSGIIVSTLTYLQFTGHFLLFKGLARDARVMGTIGNSNYLGAYLLFPLFLFAGLAFVHKGAIRAAAWALALVVFGALLCSRARASWLALGISFPLFLLIIKSIYHFSITAYMKARPGRTAVLVALALFLSASAWYTAPERFRSQMNVKEWTSPETLRLRAKYFRASWWLFKERPVFGSGLWSYRNKVYDAQAEINKKDPAYFKGYKKPQPRRVHNEYLEILNDGGLLAGGALIVLFCLLSGHGLSVIRDKGLDTQERVIVATAFSATMGIMIAAVFFFPFRINSTLFMTALMLGLSEGIYLRNRKPQTQSAIGRLRFPGLALVAILLMLIGVFWFGIVKPFRGEREYFRYMQAMSRRDAGAAEKHIRNAVSLDPGNSLYNFHAGRFYTKILKNPEKAEEYIDKAVIRFNGDLTGWGIYFALGLHKYQVGSLYEARDAFKKALYYNPLYSPAREKLKDVERILRENDKITIKLR